MKYEDIPILMYHEIGHNNNTWSVSPEDFKQQMEFMKKNGYQTISLSELKEGLEQNKTTNRKKAVITFDDGRSGVYDYAYPLLSIYNYTATIFIVAKWVGQKEIPGHENYSGFLNWDQIKELANNGFEMGSHSLSHPRLVELSAEELKNELQNSKIILEQKIGKKIIHFAYPYGKYNSEVKTEVLNHYSTAVTTKKGFDKKEGEYSRQWVTNLTPFGLFAKKLVQPKISLAMIVKDEEDVLEECLNSVKDLADEIIIVDTGSTDNTKAIAQKYTDKVFDFKWNDDFAEARNESLKYAGGDWILILDADEELDGQGKKIIKQAINNQTTEVYSLPQLHYTNQFINQTGFQHINHPKFKGYFVSEVIRLFRKQEGLRFDYCVHETILESAKKLGKGIALLDAPIHHHQELKGMENIHQKQENYFRLSMKNISLYPNYAKSYHDIAIYYSNYKQDQNKALEYCRKAVHLEYKLEYVLNLVYRLRDLEKCPEAINIIQEALETFKDERLFSALGYIYYTTKEYDAAINSYYSALNSGSNKEKIKNIIEKIKMERAKV